MNSKEQVKNNIDEKEKNRIRIMSKMAVYDKRDFEKDSKCSQYFRHDYIYKQNMRLRFFVGLGCVILIAFYLLYIIEIQEIDVFTLDFLQFGIRLFIFVIIVMASFSFIGTIIYTREYIKSQRRMEQYFSLMDELRKHNGEQTEDYDEQDDVYGAEERRPQPRSRRGPIYRYSDKIEDRLEREAQEKNEEEW